MTNCNSSASGKHPRLYKGFIISSGLLLMLAGIAKIVSALGDAKILQTNDPIFNVPFHYVLIGAGAIEITVALFCLLGGNFRLSAALITWLAFNFIGYRIGMHMSGYVRPCSCYGNLTDALHIPPNIADLGIKVILGYLLIGGLTLVFLLNRRQPGV